MSFSSRESTLPVPGRPRLLPRESPRFSPYLPQICLRLCRVRHSARLPCAMWNGRLRSHRLSVRSPTPLHKGRRSCSSRRPRSSSPAAERGRGACNSSSVSPDSRERSYCDSTEASNNQPISLVMPNRLAARCGDLAVHSRPSRRQIREPQRKIMMEMSLREVQSCLPGVVIEVAKTAIECVARYIVDSMVEGSSENERNYPEHDMEPVQHEIVIKGLDSAVQRARASMYDELGTRIAKLPVSGAVRMKVANSLKDDPLSFQVASELDDDALLE